MLRRFFTIVLFAALLSPASSIAAPTQTAPIVAVAKSNAQLAQFDTEAAAQAHCPSDTVVWLNTKSSVYHEKGMRWYGKTKHGAYVCRKEADAAGDRDTKNGQ